MALGNPDFVFNFDIIKAGKDVGHIAAKNRTLTIRQSGRDTICVDIARIESLELLHAESASIGQATAGIMVGAAVAGPLGALVGVGAGRLFREVHCVLTLAGGQAFVCTTLAKVYEDFLAHRRILAIEDTAAGQLSPARLDQLLARSAPIPGPSIDEPVSAPKSNVAIASVRPSLPTYSLLIPTFTKR